MLTLTLTCLELCKTLEIIMENPPIPVQGSWTATKNCTVSHVSGSPAYLVSGKTLGQNLEMKPGDEIRSIDCTIKVVDK
jgi:hypothetical protein